MRDEEAEGLLRFAASADRSGSRCDPDSSARQLRGILAPGAGAASRWPLAGTRPALAWGRLWMLTGVAAAITTATAGLRAAARVQRASSAQQQWLPTEMNHMKLRLGAADLQAAEVVQYNKVHGGCPRDQYQNGVFVLSCEGKVGSIYMRLLGGKRKEVVWLPENVANVSIDLYSEAEAAIQLIDELTGECIVGHNCLHSTGCRDGHACIDHMGTSIYFHINEMVAPMLRTLQVKGRFTRTMILMVKAAAETAAVVSYSAGPISPCPPRKPFPGCSFCSSYTQCFLTQKNGIHQEPKCDGSHEVKCVKSVDPVLAHATAEICCQGACPRDGITSTCTAIQPLTVEPVKDSCPAKSNKWCSLTLGDLMDFSKEFFHVETGEGEVCRGDHATDDDPSPDDHPTYYELNWLEASSHSMAYCMGLCLARHHCTGIEWSDFNNRHRCEVWTRSIKATQPHTKGRAWASFRAPSWCLRLRSDRSSFSSVSVNSHLPWLGIFWPNLGGWDRACEAEKSDNDQEFKARNIDACKDGCLSTVGCKGIEFQDGTCKVWTHPQGINGSVPRPGSRCYEFSVHDVLEEHKPHGRLLGV